MVLIGMLILGVNVLVILACVVGGIRRGGARSNKTACCRCGESNAEYSISKREGVFCKHCWYDAVENLWFEKVASQESAHNKDGAGAYRQEAKK